MSMLVSCVCVCVSDVWGSEEKARECQSSSVKPPSTHSVKKKKKLYPDTFSNQIRTKPAHLESTWS